MRRKEMVGHTVYLYEANDRRMPVLILEPRTEVTAKERYSTYDAHGQQLQVGYIRGDAPKTPGMLAIQWTTADSADEAARRLEELKDLDQSLITGSLGSRMLPDGAVAMVVWPKNIVSTWAEHIRPAPAVMDPEAEAALDAYIARMKVEQQREKRLAAFIVDALAARGVDVNPSMIDVDVDGWDDSKPPMMTVSAPLSLGDLLKLLDTELPDDLRGFTVG